MADESDKPKYQKLKAYIIETIKSRELVTGEKILSENELAEKFEISRHTVRQAVGELVAEGWLYRVQGKGTFVDRRPDEMRSQTKTIGVIAADMDDYIFPSVFKGIESILSLKGYNIILKCTYNQHEGERTCLESLGKQNIDGLIVEPAKSALPNPNIELYRELSANGVPVLFIHGCYKGLDYSFISEDDFYAGYTATKYLIGLGHEKIGGVFKIDDIQGHNRFSGFQKAHTEAGIKLLDSRVLWFDSGKMERYKSNETNRFGNILYECSGIVCNNEEIAIDVMDECREKGLKIPEDISIISFGDSKLARAPEIKLTAVSHPKEKLGEKAAEAIINMIERKRNYYDTKIRPELIIRESTKKYERKDV